MTWSSFPTLWTTKLATLTKALQSDRKPASCWRSTDAITFDVKLHNLMYWSWLDAWRLTRPTWHHFAKPSPRPTKQNYCRSEYCEMYIVVLSTILCLLVVRSTKSSRRSNRFLQIIRRTEEVMRQIYQYGLLISVSEITKGQPSTLPWLRCNWLWNRI